MHRVPARHLPNSRAVTSFAIKYGSRYNGSKSAGHRRASCLSVYGVWAKLYCLTECEPMPKHPESTRFGSKRPKTDPYRPSWLRNCVRHSCGSP